MAYTMNEVDIRGLRATHFEQLLAYLKWAEESGNYYGNKRQFDIRHSELNRWLTNLCSKARDPNCRIDNKPLFEKGEFE